MEVHSINCKLRRKGELYFLSIQKVRYIDFLRILLEYICTEDDHFAALTNRSYMLHIELPMAGCYSLMEGGDGENVPDIKGIWTVFENHEDESLDNSLNEGYRIFAS